MEQGKIKSFWERPEGTTGMIFGVAVIGAVGYVAYMMLPFIITLLANSLYAVGLGTALFLLVYVLFIDNRTRNLAWYMYKSAMRAVTQMFIEIDPIGILKSYVTELREGLGKMNKQISNLKSQMAALEQNIKQNKHEMEKNMKIASQAEKAGNRSQVVLKSRKTGRLRDSNLTLQELYNKMEVVYRVLMKMYDSSEFLIEDIDDQVKVKERERKAIQATHNAFKSAMKIINGDSDKKQTFDMTMEFLAEDYGKKVGEIEHFMTTSQSFIEGIDLQNGVFEEEGMAMLEAWEQNTECLILGEGCKEEIISTSSSASTMNFKF